jgi:hypothetical protein
MQATISGLDALRGNRRWTMMEASNVLALAADSRAQEFNEAQYKAAATSALFSGELQPTLSLPQVWGGQLG